MKSVLISIQPKWCELIARGKKTVEVRKTRPKLETPFKVYIYCTQGDSLNYLKRFHHKAFDKFWIDNKAFGCNVARANGKVIGEFVCDRIFVADCDSVAPFDKHTKRYIDKESCLSKEEFVKYTRMSLAYGWHISNLVIYDKPKELSEFHKPCADIKNCLNKAFREAGRSLEKCFDCGCNFTRPPQSWCYVEEATK